MVRVHMHPTLAAGAEGEAPSAAGLSGGGACAVESGAATGLLSCGCGTGCSAASAMAGKSLDRGAVRTVPS